MKKSLAVGLQLDEVSERVQYLYLPARRTSVLSDYGAEGSSTMRLLIATVNGSRRNPRALSGTMACQSTETCVPGWVNFEGPRIRSRI